MPHKAQGLRSRLTTHYSILEEKGLTSNKMCLPSKFALLTIAIALCAPFAEADTIQFAGLGFALSNTNGDGTASVSGTDNATLTLVGPNTGSGEPGATDLTAILPASGTLTFKWSYSSLDTPGGDAAEFFVNDTLTLLSDTSGDSGSETLSVTRGDRFGFEVNSVDNLNEPGILTVTNLVVPQVPAIPEPMSWALLLFGIFILSACKSGNLFAVARRLR